MANVTQVELEFVTINPTRDPAAQTLAICDPATGQQVAVNKSIWNIYEYNYNLVVFEERWNKLQVANGCVGVMWAN